MLHHVDKFAAEGGGKDEDGGDGGAAPTKPISVFGIDGKDVGTKKKKKRNPGEIRIQKGVQSSSVKELARCRQQVRPWLSGDCFLVALLPFPNALRHR